MQEPQVVRDDLGAVLGEELHPLPRPDLSSFAAGTGNLVARAAVPEALLALAEGLAEVPVQVGVALQVLRENLSSCYFGQLGVEFWSSWPSIYLKKCKSFLEKIPYLQEKQLITVELQPLLGTQGVEEVKGLAGARHHEVVGGCRLQSDHLRGRRGHELRHLPGSRDFTDCLPSLC